MQSIFGIDVFKSKKCPYFKFDYVLNFLAQLIDNDSDGGVADVPELIDEMKILKAHKSQEEFVEYDIDGEHFLV